MTVAATGISREEWVMLDFGAAVELSGFKLHTGRTIDEKSPRTCQLLFTDGLHDDPFAYATKWAVAHEWEQVWIPMTEPSSSLA